MTGSQMVFYFSTLMSCKIQVLKDSQVCRHLDYSNHIQNSSELIRILTAIVKTATKENKDKDKGNFKF
jgi:hypothetical protein